MVLGFMYICSWFLFKGLAARVGSLQGKSGAEAKSELQFWKLSGGCRPSFPQAAQHIHGHPSGFLMGWLQNQQQNQGKKNKNAAAVFYADFLFFQSPFHFSSSIKFSCSCSSCGGAKASSINLWELLLENWSRESPTEPGWHENTGGRGSDAKWLEEFPRVRVKEMGMKESIPPKSLGFGTPAQHLLTTDRGMCHYEDIFLISSYGLLIHNFILLLLVWALKCTQIC